MTTLCTAPETGLNFVILRMIERILNRVNALSQGGPGWTRPSYSPLETAAHLIIEEEAHALGMEVRRDHGGNLIARMPGRDPQLPPIWCGSHLDTVAEGGAYDGQAGVAAALALVAAMRSQGITPEADFVVVVTRAEESVWSRCPISARAPRPGSFSQLISRRCASIPGAALPITCATRGAILRR